MTFDDLDSCDRPAAHAAGLANALTRFATILNAAGKRQKALEVDRESVDRWRELIAAEPTAHTASLAIALTNLATKMCETGDHDGELKLRVEAVANKDPDFALRAEGEALQVLVGDAVTHDPPDYL